MKKLISKLKEVPDLESRHPWGPISQNLNMNASYEHANSFNHHSSSTYHTPNYSHLNNFIGKKFNIGRSVVIVEEIIAEGGFGIVFKVRSQNDQIFSLKRLCVNNRNDLKVCKREITIMSSLTHKNILSLIDSQINEQQSGIYEVLMLLAYCPKNVAQLMQSKQKMHQHLPENLIIKILCDIIEAVARLHYCQTPVIHRDLKVENILIDDRNNYVLCDFGSATARQIIPTEYGITKTEEEISKYTTLAYRSPEMVELGSTLINCKLDIWALGCLTYYLCYFTLPFADKILAIQSGKFSIPKTGAIYSDKLLKLIQYMLTVDPGDRPSIYQVSVLAFSMANRKSPIQNLDKEKVPQWNALPLPTSIQNLKQSTLNDQPPPFSNISKESDVLKVSSVNNASAKSKTLTSQSKSISTSINPRIRPRANKSTISRSETNENSPDILLDKPVKNISQSRSYNISLSNSRSNFPKLGNVKNSNSSCVQLEIPIHQSPTPPHHRATSASGSQKAVMELSEPRKELANSNCLNTEKIDNQKAKLGHRRMVSESFTKPVVEENLKSGKSLLELTRKNSSDQCDPCSYSTNLDSNHLQTIAIKLSDDEVENDALFGEEFDKIRHQSDTSGDD